MKKLLAFFLAAVMLSGIVSLTGCKESATKPNELCTQVNESMQKTQDLKSYSAVIKQSIKQDLMGISSESKAEFQLKASMNNPQKPVISMDGIITLAGQQMPMVYYYDGSWMYCAVSGEGYKMQASMEQFQENTSGIEQFITELPNELFDGVTATIENGVTKVELTADSEAFKAMYNDMMKDLFTDVLGDDTSKIVVDDVKMIITMANDYLKSYDISFKCNYTIGNDSISFEVVQSLVFESINEEITITPPEGYENFPEMGWG